jgi:ABC-type multidrug transport system fused ATPase/permease subunit
MIRYIVGEKEQRQKELMKMMSVTEADIGWAWFMTFFLLHVGTSVVLTLISAQIYGQASLLMLLVFWIFSFTSFIVVAMMIASLFSKTPRATFVGLIVFFFGYFTTLSEDMAEAPLWKLRLVSLHPIAAFSYGLREIGRLEDSEMGLSTQTMNSTDYESGYTFAVVLNSLFIDSILWGIVTWYLNRVIPPAYGQALPIYFPLLPSYWWPSFGYNEMEAAKNGEPALCDEFIPVEEVSEAKRMQAREGKSIEIHNLKKSFGNKTAVDGLNLSIYNGQITALLGHNGKFFLSLRFSQSLGWKSRQHLIIPSYPFNRGWKDHDAEHFDR